MERRTWRSFDWALMLATVLLVAIGILLIYSATVTAESALAAGSRSVVRQLVFGGTGLVIFMLAAAIDYRLLENLSWPFYGFSIALLGIVVVVGHTGFGAQSWLGIRRAVQPSELSKVLMIIFLAKFFADREEKMHQLHPMLLSLLCTALPTALIYLQPDMGTALVLVVIWATMLFCAGIRFAQLAFLAVLALAAAPLVWFSMKDYMLNRILIFLNPANDVSGLSYNTHQALISIGSGGLFGKGFLHGTQSQLYFLRVRHTDYIFSVLCEEWGFVGAMLLLVLLFVLMWRVLRAAGIARDAFGRLLACGVGAMFFFQALVNLAVNLNLLPVTGLTLPLVSYGGSSLWTTLLALGLVESVVMRHKKLGFVD